MSEEKKIRILVANDTTDMRDRLKRRLEGLFSNVEVLLARDLSAAEEIMQGGNKPDFIISDLLIPQGNYLPDYVPENPDDTAKVSSDLIKKWIDAGVPVGVNSNWQNPDLDHGGQILAMHPDDLINNWVKLQIDKISGLPVNQNMQAEVERASQEIKKTARDAKDILYYQYILGRDGENHNPKGYRGRYEYPEEKPRGRE